MARPSQHVDRALLDSGRALFPAAGCAGLSVRAVAEGAGANPGMFHYHFRTKENFLRTLLAEMYEDVFASLSAGIPPQGSPLARLRGGLVAMAGALRMHRRVIARVWIDAMGGHPIAAGFVREHMPRHLAVLVGLLDEAVRVGELKAATPLPRVAFLMGAVAAPVVFAAGLVDAGVAPALLGTQFDAQVLSDQAIRDRVDLAIDALRRGPAAPGPEPVR